MSIYGMPVKKAIIGAWLAFFVVAGCSGPDDSGVAVDEVAVQPAEAGSADLAAAAGAVESNDDLGPEQALALNDPNMVPYGVRMRLTSGTWEYLRLVLRDTLKQWGSPKRDTGGINLLLDPGYDYASKTAGLLRTTPFQRRWAYKPGYSCTFGDCNGSNLYRVRPGTEQWLQVRKYQAPGQLCNSSNTVNGNARGLANGDLQNLHREHGFYVTTGDQCYTEINVCTPGSSQADISTPHVGHNSAQTCTLAAIDADILGIYAEINLGAFVYPHGGIESLPTKLEPTINPPDVGTYTGFSQRYGLRGAGSQSTNSGCFLGFCSGSSSNVSAWVASNFPTSTNYDYFYQHDKDSGSYFRQGDDQAVYLNIGMMQVQSLQRVGAANIWFQLKNRQSGLCLAVSGGSSANDTSIVLETCSTAQPARQMFQYDYTNGYLRAMRLNNK